VKGHGTKFGLKKEDAVIALLTNRNIEEAAKAIGIAPNTLLRWMKEPEFQKEYREARRSHGGYRYAGFHESPSRR
jgi:transposase-like protein